MRILHIITGLGNGGAEGVLYRLVTNDKRNTHHVISMMDSGLYGERLIAKGIPVYTLNMCLGPAMIKGLFKLYQLIRTINPNVVQTWMYHADFIGGIVARLAGKRVVIWGVRASKKFQKARGSKVRKDRGSKVKKAAKILRHANLDTIWSKSSENIFATLDQRSFDNFGSASFLHFFVLPFLHLFLF